MAKEKQTADQPNNENQAEPFEIIVECWLRLVAVESSWIGVSCSWLQLVAVAVAVELG